jgi:hypothetical protein
MPTARGLTVSFFRLEHTAERALALFQTATASTAEAAGTVGEAPQIKRRTTGWRATTDNEAAAGGDSARSTGLRHARGAFHDVASEGSTREFEPRVALWHVASVGRGDDDLLWELRAHVREALISSRAGSGSGLSSGEETTRWLTAMAAAVT